MKDNIFENIGKLISFAFMIFVSSTIGGTFFWLLYPKIHLMFPTAVENGIIAKDLNWWSSVCIVWISNILLKSTTIKSN